MVRPLLVFMRANAGLTAQSRAGVGLPSSQTLPAGLSPMVNQERAGRARGSLVAPFMSASDRVVGGHNREAAMSAAIIECPVCDAVRGC